MPTPDEILAILKQTSNDLFALAIVFHILIFIALVALLKGWKPTKRVAGFMLTVLLLSVSLIAWIYVSPFNGVMFVIFFILLAMTASKLPRQSIIIASGFWRIAAVLLIAFGVFYPHFLDAPPAMYLIAAPLGLIPCPTLSAVIGFTLLFQSFNSTRWAIVLSLIGLFYGVFGVARLHVYIDMMLIIGSLLLILNAIMSRGSSQHV